MSDEARVDVGFIGLGIMGRGMAANLVRKGFPTTVWNRTPAAATPLEKEGAKVMGTPREVAAASKVVFTCVADPPALEAVALGPDGLLAGAHGELCWIDTSTVGYETSMKMAAAAAERGIGYLEAPVTGSKTGAREGTLVVMTGGPRALHDACEPVLRAFAAKVIHVGPHGTGSIMKLIGNTVLSFMLEGLAEGAVLGATAGVPIEKILEVIQASGFASPYWSFKGGAMARRNFETHFSLDLLHKDQALMLAEAAARRVPLPGLAAIHQVTNGARAMGLGELDIAAQLLAVEAGAGIGRRGPSGAS
jgi:3-hydroxyisobutyrate dehydrogenase-like beta-hydroxyacid dehydrogenase